MTDYVPGSAYKKGYDARMGGSDKTSNIFESNSVYSQEWLAGWEDAHNKIINEARANSGCTKPKCCKNFIQD